MQSYAAYIAASASSIRFSTKSRTWMLSSAAWSGLKPLDVPFISKMYSLPVVGHARSWSAP